MSGEEIPFTPMMRRYSGLRKIQGKDDERGKVGLLEQHLEKAREANGPEAVAELAADFHTSVKQAEAFFAGDHVRDEKFFATPRDPLTAEPGTGSTSQIGALMQLYANDAEVSPLWEVPDQPELGFFYLERELVVTQAQGLHLEGGGGSKEGPRIDLLLASVDGGIPIVGEVKVGGDSSPYLALIQALAGAAYLAPGTQHDRLRHHDDKDHPRLSREAEKLDIFLLASRELVNSEIREKILKETRDLSDKLVPLLGKMIRRIAAVRLDYDESRGAEGRSAEPIFAFPAPG